jgi:large subunit ribosomal protein L22
MEVRALSKYVHMSDKKVRDVTRVIAGKNANEAVQLLKFIPRKSARFVEKTLSSAIANAVCRGIRSEVLTIKEAVTEQGVAFKRFIPASRGSAHPIKKRTSHIKIVLTDHLG